jgi:hypothetical protein
MPIHVTEDIDSLIQSFLRPDESIIWIRRPQQGIKLREVDREMLPWSLAWGGSSIIFEVMAIRSGAWAGVVAILPFVLLGLYFMFGRLILDAQRRSEVYYVLTNQRVVFAYTSTARIRSFELRWIDNLPISESRGRTGTLVIGKPRPVSFWNRGAYWNREMFRGIIGDAEPRLEFVAPVEEVRDSILAARDAWLNSQTEEESGHSEVTRCRGT